MKSDQVLFAKGLATYQKVVGANYMAHREVYERLRTVLLNEAREGFVFADLACGTAPRSAAALAGPPVGRYIGIDISQPSLEVAKAALASLRCTQVSTSNNQTRALLHFTRRRRRVVLPGPSPAAAPAG